ncbi:MAG: hypothetical protein ABI645_01125 [Pseudomonadota bacterium]
MISESAQLPDQLDPFDHAFVNTLLCLRGVEEPPSYAEFAETLQELANYYSALVLAPPSCTAIDDDWLEGQSIDSAAAQLAFLYYRFGLLYRSQAKPSQLAAFQRWWATGDEAMGYPQCPTC